MIYLQHCRIHKLISHYQYHKEYYFLAFFFLFIIFYAFHRFFYAFKRISFTLVIPNLSNMKTKLLYCFMALLSLGIVSCEKDETSSQQRISQTASSSVVSTAALQNLDACVTTNLMAGQHYDAGDVRVYVDLEHVYIEYATSGNWYIKKTHLYSGNCNEIPVTRNGSPVPGQFPVSNAYPNGTQSVVYAFNKADLPECFCVAAHAEVYRVENNQIVQTETAWAQGERFTPRSWGMFFSVCQSDCFDIEDYYFGN